MNIKERILILAEKEERFKRDFFKKTELKYGNYTGVNKESDVSAKALEKIALNYPNTDLMWLITGIKKE